MADRQKAIEAFIRCGTPGACSDKCAYFSEGFNCYRAMKHDLLELLKEQPEQKFFVDSDGKITPLPIQKHGHWIKLTKFLLETQCSVCKKTHVGDCRTFNYCPNCGAIMDEEVMG